jgi:hypothetical protein
LQKSALIATALVGAPTLTALKHKRQPPPARRSKGWFAILRLYGPLESWFDKSWPPGEIEEMK